MPTYIPQTYPLWVAEAHQVAIDDNTVIDTPGLSYRVVGWQVLDSGQVNPVAAERGVIDSTDLTTTTFVADSEEEAINDAQDWVRAMDAARLRKSA